MEQERPDSKGRATKSEPKHLTPAPSCARSLLASTSTSGWAGGGRGGDSHLHPPGLLFGHQSKVGQPASSKSNQNTCMGGRGAAALPERAQDVGWCWRGAVSAPAGVQVRHPSTPAAGPPGQHSPCSPTSPAGWLLRPRQAFCNVVHRPRPSESEPTELPKPGEGIQLIRPSGTRREKLSRCWATITAITRRGLLCGVGMALQGGQGAWKSTPTFPTPPTSPFMEPSAQCRLGQVTEEPSTG